MKTQGTRLRRGFTLVEVVAAIVVAGVAMALLIGVMAASRTAADGIAERALAGSIAQGALEFLRSLEPDRLTFGDRQVPLPPEAKPLAGARLTATVKPWPDERSLRWIRVALRWRPRRGPVREVIREGLVSDRRAR